jgi:5-methylthioadenosine/S-adenosylhomocysteine deaminase
MTMQNAIRIRGTRILSLGEDKALLTDGYDILIRGDRIKAIVPDGTPAPDGAAEQVLSFSNAVTIPGLVNAHTHSASGLQRGRVPGDHLDLFLLAIMAKARKAKRSPQQVRAVTLLHGIEMLKRGITGAVDHLRCGLIPQPESVIAALSAYEEIGLRATVAPMFEDLPYIESLPIALKDLPLDLQAEWSGRQMPAPENYFSAMREIVETWQNSRLTRVMLGVDGVQRCSLRLLELTGTFASDYDMGLHTHLLEAKTQALMARAEDDNSLVARLDRFGLISPKSSLAHFVWCGERDIEIAAERRVNVVNNPVSNLVLGSGIQPTARLLAAGISVALGNDGSSSNGISILEQAKTSSLLSRVVSTDQAHWIDANAALKMATAGGMAVLGLRDEPTGIVPGALADLAVIDLNGLHHRPLGDIATHLLMYETGAATDTVLVAGEIVLRDGRCTRVDEAAVYAEVESLLSEEVGADFEVNDKVAREWPIYNSLLQQKLNQTIKVSRYADLR